MKICVFGADGRTGKEVVDIATKQGHKVISFVRSSTSEEVFPKTNNIHVGNVLDFTAVQNAVSNSDGVISVLGHVKGSDPFMQTVGITNITKAMKNSGVTRIVSLTGTGVRFEGDKPSLFDRVGNFIIKLIDRKRIVDGIEHAEVLKNSGLDWTILRVLKLSQKDEWNNKYQLTENGPAENITSRKKVAKILVDLVDSGDYIKKAPVVSR